MLLDTYNNFLFAAAFLIFSSDCFTSSFSLSGKSVFSFEELCFTLFSSCFLPVVFIISGVGLY